MGFFDRLFGSSAPAPPKRPPQDRDVPASVESTYQLENARIAPLVSGVLAELGRSVRPGLRTSELEAQALDLLAAAKLDPRMLHYRGFPAAIAVSIDDEVLHGIPSTTRVIPESALVKIQIGARTQRGSSDQGWTFVAGMPSKTKERLRVTGIQALKAAIEMLRTNERAGTLGAVIQETFEQEGFNAIRDFGGYAIGVKPMEDPQLLCYGKRNLGMRLQDGAILHVHAIGCAGNFELSIADDKWTASTLDRLPAVLFTAVVRLRPDGCDVLTPLLG